MDWPSVVFKIDLLSVFDSQVRKTEEDSKVSIDNLQGTFKEQMDKLEERLGQ